MTTDKEENENKEDKGKFSFGEHLEELRKRLIFCVISVIFCFGICWAFKAAILAFAERPHLLAMSKLGMSTNLQVISYQEGFYAYIKLCFIAAIFFAYPLCVYQIWKFASPGLYRKEKRYSLMFVFLSFFAFLTGILFGYFFLIPIGLQFLIGILGPSVAPIITMGQYVSFVFLLTIALGFVFQLPLIILLTTKIGIVKADDFVKWRKYAILAVFVIAAIITPPDPFTQVMTALPMIVLYEAGILFAKPTKRRIAYFSGMVGGGALVIFLCFTVFSAYFATANVTAIKGDVVMSMSDYSEHKIALNELTKSGGIKLQKGSCLSSGPNGRAEFGAGSGVTIILDGETEVIIVGKKAINLTKGRIFVSIPELKSDFMVTTTNGSIVSNFGDLNIEALPLETIVTVANGSAILNNGDFQKRVTQGRQGRITAGGDVADIDDVLEWIK